MDSTSETASQLLTLDSCCKWYLIYSKCHFPVISSFSSHTSKCHFPFISSFSSHTKKTLGWIANKVALACSEEHADRRFLVKPSKYKSKFKISPKMLNSLLGKEVHIQVIFFMYLQKYKQSLTAKYIKTLGRGKINPRKIILGLVSERDFCFSLLTVTKYLLKMMMLFWLVEYRWKIKVF